MQELVPQEPITALVSRITGLIDETGATVMLVCGSSSAFLSLADTVVEMHRYTIRDVTAEAKKVSKAVSSCAPQERIHAPFPEAPARSVDLSSLRVSGKVVCRDRHAIQLGHDGVLDLRAIPQILHMGQTRAIDTLLRYWLGSGQDALAEVLRSKHQPRDVPLKTLVDAFDAYLDKHGFDAIQEPRRQDGFLARPRRVDIAGARKLNSVTATDGSESDAAGTIPSGVRGCSCKECTSIAKRWD